MVYAPVRYAIRTVTPADEILPVISLDEAKEHLRISEDDEDDLIESAVLAAQDWVERYTSRVLTERTMELVASEFPLIPELISLPRDPVTEIVSVIYTDTDGEAVTMDVADYRWSEDAPDVLKPAFAASWPSAYDEQGSVRVRFEVGYGAGLAPASLVAAVKLLLGHLFANRESVVTGTIATELPLGVQALCAPYRRIML